MNTDYQPQVIEQEAQQFWEEKQCFKVTEDLGKEKFYCLSMFPYPSGNLHMGHVRNYSIGDVVARYQRMQGKNVLQPIGWDAFGLPAENAAIKNQVHPAKWTYANIDTMRAQLKRLGFAYDWRREFATCDPDYYRWEQWFFTKLFERGLVYKKNAVVNWDPVDETVLANEQVVDGKGWRSGAPVERREISQWFIKITDYAEELLADLDKLEHWPEQVCTMQRNWIGRSEGASVYFDVADSNERLRVYTTRVDTLLGCTYLGIAPEHPLAKAAAANNPELTDFIASCGHTVVAEAEMATMEKKGMATGLHAVHPITGERLPIWVANFVLMDYGSGAVMAVPAHDQRDWEFAHQYKLPIKPVIKLASGEAWDFDTAALTEYGILHDSQQFDGLDSAAAKAAITEHLVDLKKGKSKVHYRLRDWGVSRQRYWGTPIPMINCPNCGAVPVPEHDLPVVLPEDVTFTGAQSPLHNHHDFLNVACPKCGSDAQRETDTFDTFMESSWYYARFACFNQNKAMLDDRAKYWTPVDYYVGGIEHAVMHLLYARFFHKLLRDAGLVNSDEPFKKLLTQGMVLKDGAKMSKSKGNTVDPGALIDKYGSDTVRLFMLFASPPEQSLEWSDSGVEGAHRFLRRVWHLAQDCSVIKDLNIAARNGIKADIDWEVANDSARTSRREVYQILQQASFDYERSQFNTVVSGCMKLLNLLSKIEVQSTTQVEAHIVHEGFSILLRLLAPITPHIAHYLWRELEYGSLILDAPMPRLVKEAMKVENVTFVIQVNGKKRAEVNVSANADDATIESTILADADVQRHIGDKPVKKIIVLAKRQLVNVVV